MASNGVRRLRWHVRAALDREAARQALVCRATELAASLPDDRLFGLLASPPRPTGCGDDVDARLAAALRWADSLSDDELREYARRHGVD
jgi:hypothetical protein